MRDVYVDFKRGFGIAASPKVGTLSIVDFFFELHHGRKSFPGEPSHGLRELGLAHPASAAFDADVPMIAIHRDPYERIRSTSQHRVVREREAPARSFRHFCERLGYFRGYSSIAWHTDAQTHWLGARPNRYAAVLSLDELDTLPDVVARLTGQAAPAMSRSHQMRDKPDWEPGLKEMLEPWVADDLRVGWNGETSIGRTSDNNPGGS